MPNMRDGFRYALLVAAGLVAVLFVIAFTAWGLTTYGSVRHVVGDLAAQPDKAADLRDQYEEMATQFSGGASSFTYYYRSEPITVAPEQVTGMGESEVISLVLDVYTSGLYDNSLQSGGLGAANVFVGSTGNLLYALAALVFAIAFTLFTAGAVRGFAELPLTFRLKSAGKTIAAFCAAVFFIFALLPGLLKSLFWGSVANGSSIRDSLDILEPGIVGSLLRNMLLVILIAGAIYVAGFWLSNRDDIRDLFKASRVSAQKDNAPQNRKRRSL
jgi:hypothetical protein